MRWALLIALVVGVSCARGGSGTSVDSRTGGGDGNGQIDGPTGDGKSIDASNGCSVQPCDIATQCGCTASQACDLNSTLNGNACRAVTTPGTETATCTDATGCAKDYTCVGSTAGASCDRYCLSNADCTPPRGQCVVQLTDGNNMPIPNAIVCSSNCDPSTTNNTTTCPTNWTCDLFTATFMGTMHDISDCRPNGTAAANATCSATVACAAGLTCVNTGTSTVCKKICNKTANTGCTTGTCTSFSPATTIGGTEYGVCI